MTDPVNTDALRAWNAAIAHDKLFPMVAAAADEIDRLRKDKETLLMTLRNAAEAYIERAAAHDEERRARRKP